MRFGYLFALVLLPLAAMPVGTMPGCTNYAEGQQCSILNMNDDCDEGLICTPMTTNGTVETSICCLPAGNTDPACLGELSTSSSSGGGTPGTGGFGGGLGGNAGGGGAAPCAHNFCDVGERLVESCDPCVEAICTSDDTCCMHQWDGVCVGYVKSICGKKTCESTTTTGAGEGGAGGTGGNGGMGGTGGVGGMAGGGAASSSTM